MKTGLYFGTFNPIHNGHIAIADYMANRTGLEEVWLMVSPQNPLKKDHILLDDHHRFEIVKAAIAGHPRLSVSDIEFSLPKPSYTIQTLEHLSVTNTGRQFVLIIGEDNLRVFHKWKDWKNIVDRYEIFVYPRAETTKHIDDRWERAVVAHPHIRKFDVPLINISATELRNLLREGKDVSQHISGEALNYIFANHLYY